MKPEFIDNFLGKKEFDELQTLMMGMVLPWNYNSMIDRPSDVNKFQFVHVFYNDYAPFTYCDKLNPILETLEASAIIRIKANLLTRTPQIVENLFHTDINYVSKELMEWGTTSIFYVNTNNGYTKFEDGTIIESVANRMVFFPSNIKHTGTSCTDENTRVIINFNYFK
jgi:hypothetical protein